MIRRQKSILALTLAFYLVVSFVIWGNDQWPVATFLGGTPILLVLLATWGCAVAMIVARIRRSVFGMVLPLALTSWALWPSPMATPDPNQPSLNVVTWNMEDVRGDEEAKLRWLASLDADLIFLQETASDSGESLHPRIGAALPMHCFFGSYDRGVYVRGRVIEDKSKQTAIPHHRRDVPMALVETRLGRMQVGTLHLVHGMDPRWILRRLNVWERLTVGQDWREKQLDTALEQLEPETAPIILAGDFNLQPFGAQNRKLAARFQDAGRINELRGTWKDAVSLFRIDRIWASRELVVTSRESFRRPDSDHHAIVATFQFRK